MSDSPANTSWSSLALIRLNAFSFGLTGFVLAMDTAVLPVIVLSLAPEGLKNSYLAALGMGGLLVAALVQPLIGRLSDRTRSPLGRRVPYIVGGTVVVCVSLVLTLLAPNFVALFATWMFIQASLNIAYGPGMALIRDLVPRTQIGVASSLKILLDAVGGLALITASAALIGQAAEADIELVNVYVNWEWAILALLITALLVTVGITCSTVLARDPRRRARLTRRTESAYTRILNPQMGLFLASRLLMMTAIYSFPTYGLFFLRDVFEAENPAQTLSQMIPTIGSSLAVAVFVAGRVSDRVGRKPVVIAGAVAGAVSTAWLLTTDTTGGLLITASIVGASAGTMLSASWALANEMGDEQHAGTHIGIVNLSTIGGAAIPRLFGPGIDLLNHTAEDLGYKALIGGCAALFVAGAIALLPVRPTHDTEVSGLDEPHEPAAIPPAES